MATFLPDPEETDRVLLKLASEAHKHARQQLIAARAVFDVGVWSVAFANAALVLEELGKAMLSTSALMQPHEQRLESAEFFRSACNSHEMKAFYAFMMLSMVNEDMPEEMEELFKLALRSARRTHKNKMRGLYTDANASGHVLKPSDITEEQARQMLQVVESVMALSVDSEEALEDPEAYMRTVRRIRKTEAYQTVFAEMDDDDSATELVTQTVGLARRVTRGDVPFLEALKGTWLAGVVDELEAGLLAEKLAALPLPAAPGERAALPSQSKENVTEVT
ncbi:AbiV family abortive infection protein [Streptomyces sp. NPDC001675]